MTSPLPIHAVSGQPLFQGGTGNFIGLVSEQIERENLPMRLVSPGRVYPVMKSIREGRWWRGAVEPVRRRLSSLRLHRVLRRSASLENPLLLFHPQSIGLEQVALAVERRRGVTWLFVLDAGFFCRKAYNSLPGELAPCFRCLGNDSAGADGHGCAPPYPKGCTPAAEVALRRLGAEGRILFMTQTEGHAELLRRHLGAGVMAVNIGLEVPDMESSPTTFPEDGFDVVFHAAPSWAKGVGVLMELAALMPGRRFLGPFSQEELGAHVPARNLPQHMPPNLTLKEMTWPSGLREQVQKARSVLCPSVWTAPVEGAILKSLAHNGVVATFRGRGQFGAEIPAEALVALDASDLRRSAENLETVLRRQDLRTELRRNAAAYMKSYRAGNARIGHRICRTILDNTGRVAASGLTSPHSKPFVVRQG